MNKNDIEKQFNDLTELYKQFVNIFNEWHWSYNEEEDFYNMNKIQNIYFLWSDLLEHNGKIKKNGIKGYIYIE